MIKTTSPNRKQRRADASAKSVKGKAGNGTMPTPTNGSAPNKRTVDQFVILINAEWQKSVGGFFAIGDYLIAAKAELKHGEFQAMIEMKLKIFGDSTARKFMNFARHPWLRSHVNDLPANWSTLYQLSLISAEDLEQLHREKK
jgi:hypothetical protein